MTILSFDDLRFEEKDDTIRVTFKNLFYFELNKKQLEVIGSYTVTSSSIIFKDVAEKRAFSRFNILLSSGMSDLKSRLTGKEAIYIHQNSGIPLIGTNYFGIIDRGTNIIELKPMNGCNLDCIYCSVDEGFSSTRLVDYIVEKDYLVSEFKKLLDFKASDSIHALIAGQGETLLYPDIIDLVGDLAKIQYVKNITIITNGIMLTRELIDTLVDKGLTRLNISINSLEQELADKIANRVYNLKKVKEMIRYASKKLEVVLVPVLLPTINDTEIPKIIDFAKEIKEQGGDIRLGIQNFLNYRFGRNPVKQISWEQFYARLSEMQGLKDMPLIYKEEILIETRELTKPFRKGQLINARVVCNGRIKNEKLAVADGRVLSVLNCKKDGDIKVRIIRIKHNIFAGIVK